jgi:hypothetical protein
MVTSSTPDSGVIRPDKCAFVTDCGARDNDVVDKATVDGYGEVPLRGIRKTYSQLLSLRRIPGSQPYPKSIPSSGKAHELEKPPKLLL